MSIRIIMGDALTELGKLPAESVHCCVTSPPYFGLRDYGTASWDGGDPACDHSPEARGGRFASPVSAKQASNTGSGTASRAECPCGARRIDAQLGLEPTPDAYVAAMVGVFREVRRVLRPDATLWLNIGDSYASGGRKSRDPGQSKIHPSFEGEAYSDGLRPSDPDGIKPKDLIGIPWMLAFALRADGWYLRQDIIWAKPNPMPESVTDRCTKAHEYLFLLSKSERYYFDATAIAEPPSRAWWTETPSRPGNPDRNDGGGRQASNESATRNKRSVWTIATAPFPEAHFATFPPALVEPCVLAGTSAKGACPHCGAQWVRQVERGAADTARARGSQSWAAETGNRDSLGGLPVREAHTTGWSPSCRCPPADPVPAVILDCFLGAGTTALVADRLGRSAIGIELNPAYAEMARRRIADDAGLFFEAAD